MMVRFLIDGAPTTVALEICLMIRVNVAPHHIIGNNKEGDGLLREIYEYPKRGDRLRRRRRAAVGRARLPSPFCARFDPNPETPASVREVDLEIRDMIAGSIANNTTAALDLQANDCPSPEGWALSVGWCSSHGGVRSVSPGRVQFKNAAAQPRDRCAVRSRAQSVTGEAMAVRIGSRESMLLSLLFGRCESVATSYFL